jgi:monofunctional chorismate mutase
VDQGVPVILSSLLCGDAGSTRESSAAAVRLATTCREDTPAAIADAVRELVRAFHQRNDVRPDAIRVVIFTATPDLRTAKPAAAARGAGWVHAQYLCLAEMPTNDDLARCIRALLIVDRGQGADALRPVYINGTEALRPDFTASTPQTD